MNENVHKLKVNKSTDNVVRNSYSKWCLVKYSNWKLSVTFPMNRVGFAIFAKSDGHALKTKYQFH